MTKIAKQKVKTTPETPQRCQRYAYKFFKLFNIKTYENDILTSSDLSTVNIVCPRSSLNFSSNQKQKKTLHNHTFKLAHFGIFLINSFL